MFKSLFNMEYQFPRKFSWFYFFWICLFINEGCVVGESLFWHIFSGLKDTIHQEPNWFMAYIVSQYFSFLKRKLILWWDVFDYPVKVRYLMKQKLTRNSVRAELITKMHNINFLCAAEVLSLLTWNFLK